MHRLLVIFFIILSISSELNASTRADVKIIEASENIRYFSQKIAKEYLYLYYNPKKTNFKNRLYKSMKELEKNINTIAFNTKSDESKNILDFLTYTNEEIKVLLTQVTSKDKSILILDYSETFIEASNAIQSLHKYEFSEEEKMLMEIKDLEYLLERVTKYYISCILNLNTTTNSKQMQKNIDKIENTLQKIINYPYPEEIKLIQEEIIHSWTINKKYLTLDAKLNIPNLVHISIKNLQNDIKHLELYHKKNQ